MIDRIPVRRALLSVTDKTGLVDLARALAARGVELLSTGGTAATLREAGLPVIDVAAVTGLPEMLDGRVKTLHPMIHGGLLADRDRDTHRADLERHGIAGIDLLIVNLYAFEATVARAGITPAEGVEKIDIGGPAMIRAASKNHRHVVVLTDPAQYGPVLAELVDAGGVSRDTARRLAGAAFARTAAYDAAIADWFAAGGAGPVGGEAAESAAPAPADGAESAVDFPERWTLSLAKQSDLRYGENPHQPAALYRAAGGGGGAPGLPDVAIRHGKEMSYTNWLDLDRAVRLLFEFDEPAAVVIKHAAPCGVGFGATIESAFARAWKADSLSGFGGIVGLTRPCDAATARLLAEPFLEIVAAPRFDDDAFQLLSKKKNVRLIEFGELLAHPPAHERLLRPIVGGWLAQAADPTGEAPEFRVVTRRAPTDLEARALRRAWRIVKHEPSNAIVLADDTGSVGLGGGQTSRVDAVEDAIRKAARGVGLGPGTVLASDAFFPFRDSIDAAHAAGIRAVIQPGGSVRDEETIAAADEHDMTMVFTGRRAFRH
jgi:phosphoribosylaminoimidazolecarboxamide formyltransferase/IMP cyclohydrolase